MDQIKIAINVPNGSPANAVDFYVATPGATNYTHGGFYTPIPNEITYIPLVSGWYYFYVDFVHIDIDGNRYHVERKDCRVFYAPINLSHVIDYCSGTLSLFFQDTYNVFGIALFDIISNSYIYAKPINVRTINHTETISLSSLGAQNNNNIVLRFFTSPIDAPVHTYCEYPIGNISTSTMFNACFLDESLLFVKISNPLQEIINVSFTVKDRDDQTVLNVNNITVQPQSNQNFYYVITNNQNVRPQVYNVSFIIKNSMGSIICTGNNNYELSDFFKFSYDECSRTLSVDLTNSSCIDNYSLEYEILRAEETIFSGTLQDNFTYTLPDFLNYDEAKGNAGTWFFIIKVYEINGAFLRDYVMTFEVFTYFIDTNESPCTNVVYNSGNVMFAIPFYIFNARWPGLLIEYYYKGDYSYEETYTITIGDDFRDFLHFDENGPYEVKIYYTDGHRVKPQIMCHITTFNYEVNCQPNVRLYIENYLCQKTISCNVTFSFLTENMQASLKIKQDAITIYTNNLTVSRNTANVRIPYSVFVPYLTDRDVYEVIVEILDALSGQTYQYTFFERIFIYDIVFVQRILNGVPIQCDVDFYYRTNSPYKISLTWPSSLTSLVFTPISPQPGSPYSYQGNIDMCDKSENSISLTIEGLKTTCNNVYTYNCPLTVKVTISSITYKEKLYTYTIEITSINSSAPLNYIGLRTCVSPSDCGKFVFFAPVAGTYDVPSYNHGKDDFIEMIAISRDGCLVKDRFKILPPKQGGK